MNLLFITTSNLATNPRLVKEIKLASSLGFDIDVVQFKLNNWSDELTNKIKADFSEINIIELEAGRKPFWPWLVSSILESGLSLLSENIIPTNWLSISLNKRAYLVQRRFGLISTKPDLIIAHNPGSFYPALKLARVFQTEFAIDVEDYHPGETQSLKMAKRMKKLMLRVLPSAKYVSFASKLILEQVCRDFKSEQKSIKLNLLINNVFPREEFLSKKPFYLSSRMLNFIWFSQNIDYSRGLESILLLLDKVSTKVSLTLIGNVRSEFQIYEISKRDYIRVEKPMPQIDLHKYLSNFDIGLALEPGKDLNNAIAVSNKIWAYLQSGLYILATPTPAQIDFLANFPLNGEILRSTDVQDISQIEKLIQFKDFLRLSKIEREKINQTVNWNIESEQLKSIWTKTVIHEKS